MPSSAPPARSRAGRAVQRVRWVRPGRRSTDGRPAWWYELGFLGGLYLLYSLIRNAAPTRTALAEQNAASVMHLERILSLDIEQRANAFAASVHPLVVGANYYYSTLHFIVTGAVLVWVYVARPRQYRRVRSVLLGMTLLALAGYWLFPLAPPRLTTGYGFIDTVRVFGVWGATGSEPVVSVSNQYAAMPSMHVGWALWAGLTLAVLARRRLVRVLGASYPVLTFVVVVLTANHFVLDAVGAVLVFAVAAGAVQLTSPERAGPSRAVHPDDALATDDGLATGTDRSVDRRA